MMDGIAVPARFRRGQAHRGHGPAIPSPTSMTKTASAHPSRLLQNQRPRLDPIKSVPLRSMLCCGLGAPAGHIPPQPIHSRPPNHKPPHGATSTLTRLAWRIFKRAPLLIWNQPAIHLCSKVFKRRSFSFVFTLVLFKNSTRSPRPRFKIPFCLFQFEI